MAILSVQSSVAAGHVGNQAATLPLQRLGFEVWPVDTVIFSNHPAHGGHSGRIVDSTAVSALIGGLEALGLWADCAGVLSGYLGRAATGTVIVDAVRRIRAVRKDMLFLCDPVMGDDGKIYVETGIADFFRTEAVAAADIVTPNAFEATELTGIDAATADGAIAAARALRARGPRIAVVTGVAGDTPDDRIETIAVSADGAWRVRTPAVAGPVYGAGDLFAALFLGHLLRQAPVPEALSNAVSAVHALITFAPAGRTVDLPLVEGQHLLLDPKPAFNTECID